MRTVCMGVGNLRLKMPYDALKDFVPIIQMNSFPQVLISNATIAKILDTKAIRELWAGEGMAVVINTPEEFARRVREDCEKYGRIVKAVGIKPE